MLAKLLSHLNDFRLGLQNLATALWQWLRQRGALISYPPRMAWRSKPWLYTLWVGTSVLFLITIIALQQRNVWQDDAARASFEEQATHWQDYLKQEITVAQRSLKRLRNYVDIFGLIPLPDQDAKLRHKKQIPSSQLPSIAFLQTILSENLQLHPHQFSHYFALEPKMAKQYFQKNTFMLMVSKNIKNLNSAAFNKPETMRLQTWQDKNYLYNQRESWYHQNKQNERIHITQIYDDKNYTRTKILSITQGLYDNHAFQGVVGIGISIESLFSTLEKVRIGELGGLILVNHETGEVLTHTGRYANSNHEGDSLLGHHQREEYNLYHSSSKRLWENLLKHNARNTLIQGEGNNPILYRITSRRLQSLPWTLLAYQPAELSLRNSHPFQLLFISAIIWLLVCIIIWFLYHYYHQPLNTLIEQIETYNTENHKQNIVLTLLPRAMSEIQQLKNSIQTALEQMDIYLKGSENQYQSAQIQIDDYRQQLEQQYQVLAQHTQNIQTLKQYIQQYKTNLKAAKLQIQQGKAKTYNMRSYAQKLKIHAQRSKAQEKHARQAKTQFLANMNLELRTPMNAIIGYTEIVQEDAEDLGYENLAPDLQKIHGASYHLLELINNLFDLSRLDNNQITLYLETFDITPMLQDVMLSVQPLLIQYNNQLKLQVDDALGTMNADQTKLRQNLLNLLNNACKYAKDSQIIINAHRKTEQGVDWIYFHVIDKGIGMTHQQLNRLSQLFENSNNNSYEHYNIAGSGLTLTRQFCQLMGGEMRVESQRGEGSEFVMKIPANVSDS